jgi:hypothetical protein
VWKSVLVGCVVSMVSCRCNAFETLIGDSGCAKLQGLNLRDGTQPEGR